MGERGDSHDPIIRPCGDAALTVEFGDRIDPQIHGRVMALEATLAAQVPGVVETVPTYRSLLVCYDPAIVDFDTISRQVAAAAGDGDRYEAARPPSHWKVPIVYGGAFGVDFLDVADRHDLSPAELIDRHAAPVYRVYMIGFMPGFSYLGGLDPHLETPRLQTPRARTPAGSISIGGQQAAIASLEAPSGWHLLGRTPMRNFMPGRDPVFILQPGDLISFEPVEAGCWDALDRAAEAGELIAERLS